MTEPDLAEQLLPAMNTIRGDLRDIVIGAMGQMTRLWKDMPETEQIQLAQVIDAHAQGIVTRIAVLTATAGRPTVLVNLDRLDISEKARGTFSVSKDHASALVPFTDQIVAIMAVGPNQFMGERAPVKTMSDQPVLPMGEPEPPKSQPVTIEIAAPVPAVAPKAAIPVVTPTARRKPGPKPKPKTGNAKVMGSPFPS